jgi:hypothetical protein
MTQYTGGSVPMPKPGIDDGLVKLTFMGTVLGDGPLGIAGARIVPITCEVPRDEAAKYDIDANGIAHRKWNA